MKNNITELVFVLDKSGSMAGLESDTIGGFNAMIEKQKALEGRVYVSTVLFSDESTVIHDRQSIESIRHMMRRDYSVGGCTALLDAVGGAIHHIGTVHRYARPEDVPEHTIFVITTDGMENSSRRYSAEKVREMIRKEEQKYGWEFLFLGANIDAAETAERIGIRRERSANYRATPKGTKALYTCLDEAVTCMRSEIRMKDDWAKGLEKEEN